MTRLSCHDGARRVHFVPVSERSWRRRPLERLHGNKPTQEFVFFEEEVLAAHITPHKMNRMNARYQYGLAWNAKQQRRVFQRECRWCIQSSSNLEIGTSGQMGSGGNQQRDCSAVENDRWKVDSGQTRSASGPNSNPPLPFEGARIQRVKITQQDIIAGCESKSVSAPLFIEQSNWNEEVKGPTRHGLRK